MTKFELKVEMVKELESLTKQIQKRSKELLTTIEKEGISGYYSIDSDLLDMALRIHKVSAILGYMNTLNVNFTDD